MTISASLTPVSCKGLAQTAEQRESISQDDFVEAQKALEEGLVLSPDINNRLADVFDAIVAETDDPRITWLQRGRSLVFCLKSMPSIVFKMPRGFTWPELITKEAGRVITPEMLAERRYDNMVKAKSVCMTHHLSQLVIPSAKKIELQHKDRKYVLIAEQKLDIGAADSVEESFRKQPKAFEKTIRHLTTFIAKTGFNDVTWRNIPLVAPEKAGEPYRIALIDLEDMENVAEGLWGGSGHRGLLKCVSENLIDSVIDEARNQGAEISPEVAQLKQMRLAELKFDQDLEAFHEKRGVKTGDEPLHVTPEDLGLNLDEKATYKGWDYNTKKFGIQEISVRGVFEMVIDTINETIKQNATVEMSRKGKRTISLDIPSQIQRAGSPPGDKEGKNSFMYRVIQALIDKGYIYSKTPDEKGGELFVYA